ncbi:Peptidase M16-like protein [Candidatus Sulfotelmatobacter sp. SbA7]|nr:Peptidase M16-like protein [Candidatus Sulfotelmatobacter sp. SbA7]
MKRRLTILALIIGTCGILKPLNAAAQATDWQQVPIPALHAFHPQEPKRIELPNGMVIFLQEDHELPLIDGTARVRGGSRSEPANKAGMLDIYGDVWRTGGTKSQTGDQLDDFLEVRAAKIETGSSADSTSISWSCLKGDFDDVFKVFTDLLRDPEFRADKLDLAQKGMDDSISRRNDEVGDIAGREAAKLAYGADNPYTRQPEYATVAAVTRQDLIDWHHAHVHPNNMILGIAGDFDSAAMEAKLRQIFGGWAKGPADTSPDIEFHPAKPGYYLIPKTDVNQSNIRMVELGIRRDDPDYYAAQVFNDVFGNGFSSRLVQSIRTAKGLAYTVGGGIGSAFDHPGVVRLSMGTKSASTVEAIQALDEELDKLKTHPISDDEIKRAKDSILNSFVFNFDSPEKVLHEKMAYEFYGYPPDFLERFRSAVEKVQAADVARVVAKYVHKDQLAVLVVGNTADFDKPLSTLGEVKNIDITIPPPPAEKKEETPAAKPTASNPEGKALAAKVVEALGGLPKLQSVNSLQADLTEQDAQGGPPTTVQITIAFPDRMHVQVQTPQGPFAIVVTPDAGFMSAAGMGVRDLPPPQKAETVKQIHRDLVYIAQHLNDPAFIFAAGGTETVGGVETRIVDVSAGDMAIRWFVDPKTGHVVQEAYEAVGRSGQMHGETALSDWKTTDGITLPALHKNKENGQDSSIVEFTRIQFNPAIDPKLFEKPAAEAKPAQ